MLTTERLHVVTFLLGYFRRSDKTKYSAKQFDEIILLDFLRKPPSRIFATAAYVSVLFLSDIFEHVFGKLFLGGGNGYFQRYVVFVANLFNLVERFFELVEIGVGNS